MSAPAIAEETADCTVVGDEDNLRPTLTDPGYDILSGLISPPPNLCKFLMKRLIKEVMSPKYTHASRELVPREMRRYFSSLINVCRKLQREDERTGPSAPVKDYDRVIQRIARIIPFHYVLSKTLRDLVDDFSHDKRHKIRPVNLAAYNTAIQQMLTSSCIRLHMATAPHPVAPAVSAA